MLETIIITLREAIEAFLIVAIITGYLASIGKQQLFKSVWAGIGFSIMLSLGFAYIVNQLNNGPLMEGLLSIIAGILVIMLVVHMMRSAKHMGAKIKASIDKQAYKPTIWAMVGVFSITVVLIAREGVELVLILSAVAKNTSTINVVLGIAIGAVFCGIFGYLWVKNKDKINLNLFFKVTSFFLILFSIHLILYGLYEITETDFLPIDNEYWHGIFKLYKNNDFYVALLTYGIVIVPFGWLLISQFSGKKRS